MEHGRGVVELVLLQHRLGGGVEAALSLGRVRGGLPGQLGRGVAVEGRATDLWENKGSKKSKRVARKNESETMKKSKLFLTSLIFDMLFVMLASKCFDSHHWTDLSLEEKGKTFKI